MGAAVIAAFTFLGLFWKVPAFAVALKDPYARWALIVLIVSVAGLVTYPLEHGGRKLQERRKNAALNRKILARLAELTPHEKKVLQRYLQEESTTASWGRGGGTVDALARDGILVFLVSDQEHVTQAPDVYAINNYAWKHLNSHPELIGIELLRPVTPPQL